MLVNIKYERGNYMKKKLKAISIIGIFLILFIVGCESDLLEKSDKAI